MNGVWRWEIRDKRGEIDSFGTLTLWGDANEQRQQADKAADDRIAVLLYRVEPDYCVLAGWSVQVRSDEHDHVAVSRADDWLKVLRSGVLANRIRRENWRGRQARRLAGSHAYA